MESVINHDAQSFFKRQ